MPSAAPVTAAPTTTESRAGASLVAFARRWGWLAMLVSGLAMFIAVRAAVISTGNPNLVPALILLGAVTVPCSFATLVAQRLPGITVTTGAVLCTAVVGGVTGLVCAGVLEYDATSSSGHLPAVTVALIEELVKLIAPLAFVLFARRTTLADGLVIAVASSAAFAALETMGYAATTLIRDPNLSQLSAVDDLLLWRGLLSPAGHIAWTAIAGTALWWAVQRRWAPRATARFVVAFALAVALHTLWDSVASLPAYLCLAAISLPLLGYTAHRAQIGTRMLAEAREVPQP